MNLGSVGGRLLGLRMKLSSHWNLNLHRPALWVRCIAQTVLTVRFVGKVLQQLKDDNQFDPERTVNETVHVVPLMEAVMG